MPRLLVALGLLLALTAGPSGARATSPGSDAVVRLGRPVQGEVVARFDAPTRYGAGHRGVDLAAAVGTEVVAPAGGRVTFAGTVVGSRWVTVDHGSLRSTVGPLATIGVRTGAVVETGAPLGTSGRAHGVAAVHWSLRRGDTYLDPLGAAAPRVATLLPGARSPLPAATARGPWRGRVR